MPEGTTPDTTAYLLLGLAAVFVIMGGLISSMILRYRNLKKDLELMQQMAEDDQG